MTGVVECQGRWLVGARSSRRKGGSADRREEEKERGQTQEAHSSAGSDGTQPAPATRTPARHPTRQHRRQAGGGLIKAPPAGAARPSGLHGCPEVTFQGVRVPDWPWTEYEYLCGHMGGTYCVSTRTWIQAGGVRAKPSKRYNESMPARGELQVLMDVLWLDPCHPCVPSICMRVSSRHRNLSGTCIYSR